MLMHRARKRERSTNERERGNARLNHHSLIHERVTRMIAPRCLSRTDNEDGIDEMIPWNNKRPTHPPPPIRRDQVQAKYPK
jgi:hypothetical protein